MYTVLLILILLGALISAVSAFRALGAYLRFRRARAAFQEKVTDEVAHLSARTDELEISLSALDARAAELPIQIFELQQSLTTLQVLTRALGTSLRQVQRVLSYNALKTLSAARIGKILQTASAPKDRQPSGWSRRCHGRRILQQMDEESAQQAQNTEVLKPSGEDCEICGTEMYGLHCKLICPNCGYRRDCSDP